MSTFMVSFVSRPGGEARALSTVGADEQTAREFCKQFATTAHSVVLYALSNADGQASPVASWKGGRVSRELPAMPTVAPIVIDGHVDEDHTEEIDAAPGDDTQTFEGYCVKCHEKREFVGEVGETENGRRRAKGNCPVCGTNIFRFLKNAAPATDDADDFDAPDEAEASIAEAIADAVPEGTPMEGVAAATSTLAAEFSEAANDAEVAPEPPKKRSRAKKSNPVSDAEVEAVKKLAVADCPNCRKKIPVKESGDGQLRYLMVHPGENGQPECRGSRSTVES